MLTPSSDEPTWSISSTSSYADEMDSITITIENGSGHGHSTVCTIRKTGTRVGPNGSVHGHVSDDITTAELAIESLLLEMIPAGLGSDETRSRMADASALAGTLARDRNGWSVLPLPLDGVDYALWTRTIPAGIVAHADLGWASVAFWGATALYSGPFVLTDSALHDRG